MYVLCQYYFQVSERLDVGLYSWPLSCVRPGDTEVSLSSVLSTSLPYCDQTKQRGSF